MPQGSTLSPFLFNIAIDSLVGKLPATLQAEDNLLLYADDICVFFQDRDQLNQIIENLEGSFAEEGMAINKLKSGILFKSLKMHRKIPMVREIKAVESYKYLGVLLDRNLNLELQRKVIAQKCGYISRCLNKIPKEFISPEDMCLLFSILLKSILQYGSELIQTLKKSYISK